MKKRIKAPAVLLFLILPSLLFAQTNVSGRVTDAATNSPLQGATVTERGTTASTQTDADGKFSITVRNAQAKLEISFVGYLTQTVDATNNVAVALALDNTRLSEVVVTGLASSVKRSNLANAVASVTGKELVGTTVQSTVDGALYGKFTGANISANSGAPGGGISMKLRGITSLVANSQPLFIVDGVYYDNSSINAGLNVVSKAAGQGSILFQDDPSNRVADLDPQDIDRIEILKGASAAAIYGSRAAGGVVIITTKRGKAGKPKIEIAQSVGVQMQLHKLGQRTWDDTKVQAAFGANGLSYYIANNRKIYDYEKELYGNHGMMLNTRVSVSGGNDKTTYYAGYTRKDDEGIVERTGYRKSSFRLNLTQKITNFLDLSVNSNYVESEANRGYFNNDNTSTTLGVSFVSTPSWANLYPDANGNYPNNPFAPSNFIQTRDLMTNKEKVSRMLVGGNLTWKVFSNTKQDLKIIARGGIDNYTLNTEAIFPQELQFEKDGNGTNGASIYGTTLTRNSNYNFNAVHEFIPNDKMSFRTQVGVTGENVNLNTVINTATQLIGTQTNLNQAGAIQVTQNKILQKDRGFFVQEEFNYDDIAIVTAGLRGDKSSRNGDANKLYYYPKFSVAFNIHQLSAWQSETISQLKLRAAYGQSGNFAPFGAIYTPLVPVVFNGTTGSLITLTQGNELLGPEKQSELETGVDIGFLRNRFTIEATYYSKKVEDLLLNVQIPTATGYTFAWRNVANINNHGFEIALNAVPVSNKTWRWNSGINFWKNKAEVTRLDVPAFNTGGFGQNLGTYRIQQGKSPTQLVGIAGPGDKVDPESGLGVFGDAEPDFQVSFTEGVTYKNWEFNVLMHWKQGGDNINLSTLLSDIFGTSPDYDDKTADPSGVLANGPYRLNALGTTAKPMIQDAGYFRFREIGLSYHLPKTWFKNMADVKVGFSGRNLINFFKYNSYDPEVSNFGTNAISSNVEVTPFPSAKSFNFDLVILF
ncbi:MAG: SusC/RagA family TonB-linked outer membrane protein [Bacteroidetes bacterium]|nr:MAG: SusC/RagA family TonB-linked outer membrane protein [Bacteroidota bacterium]